MSELQRRNHVLYILTNTVTGEQYVGLTVAQKRAYLKSARERFRKHCVRAQYEQHDWRLCTALRTHTPAAFTVTVHAVVKGRVAAHQAERALIAELTPALNTR